ncbi:tumor necrosis factor [Microcaecilia unicolor]|uniref:Lymphotoxin-alpha n=1 Tax=Microcaecilia unicolor TaxID=1415580 RepID=A0A6P7X6H0_9AMPH|nr:tumor necrosis factor-like [Microcaecilia unicolor]
MSADNIALDPEKGGLVVIRESRRSDHCWKYLGLFSILLLVGVSIFFTLIHFRVIPLFGRPEPNDLLNEQKAASAKLYETPYLMKLQAMKANKPAAHLTGHKESDKLVWSEDELEDPYEDNSAKMEVQNNELVIPTDGLYFVYTQVVYKGLDCQNGPIYLVHTVNHISTEFEKKNPILSASKTACENQGYKNVWFHTLYQGAVFRLNEGDRLSTETLETSRLYVAPGQNYFGAVAL